MSSSVKIRWWPAATILVLALGYLSWVWLGDAPSNQDRVIRTFPGLFFGAVLLLLWLLFFSRLPGRRRLMLFAGVVVAAVLFFALFHIEGVSGNLVPIVRPKWEAARDFGATVEAAQAGVTAPGPYDYPQFYGPRRDGTVTGVRLAADWEVRPPREVWRHDVGEGWSSFAVVGEAAVTQELRGEQEVVVRYELETGRTVWVHAYDALFATTIGGSGPRATPVIADGRVFALGALGDLTALDLDDGSLVWSENVVRAHGSEVPQWGVASSPLVVGDLVVVQPGWTTAGASLVAYRRDDGRLAWKAGEHRGSFSSPYLATVAGRPQIVIVNQESVDAHDPETGEVLWTTPWPGGEPKVSMPLALGADTLLVSSGYGIGSRLLRITDGGGALAVEDVWESRRLKSKFANMVLHEGTVYGLDDGVMTAIDPATGERRWKGGRYGHGQFLLVGGLLLVQTEKGPVVLVAADPDEHRELGHLPALEGKTWNPPALSGRYLLLRNNEEAVCYELPLEG